MTEFDRREYQTVVLAALLHDVGKFLHRGVGEYKGSHEDASSKFVKKYCDELRNDELYDTDLIKLIVQHHHSPKAFTLNDPYFNTKTEEMKERIWKLIRIVQDADSYSCAERDLEQQRRRDVAFKSAPLDSIFSNVNLNISRPHEKNTCRYHVTPLDPLTSFPDSINALGEKEIEGLIEEFEENIPEFSGFKSFDDVLNAWLNLLEQYTWAVPSDTRYETSDVSLYDHLKSSCAIATCLYKRHIIAIEKGKKFDRRHEFILIGGDFSGIQDYIFDITNKGSGGASKRLRARSLFIFLFSEVTIHKILHALDLPLACNLFSAGGKFLLLAPNIEGVEDVLQKVKTEIENEIHQTYFNQFSFLMSWMGIRGFKSEFKVYSFFKTADEMFHQLETEKLRKSRNVLTDGKTGFWNVSAFKATKIYAQYKEAGDCKICGKGPAICKDTDPDTGESIMSCPICYRDKFVIGQELPKSNYIAFGKGPLDKNGNGKKIVIFDHQPGSAEEKTHGYYVELLREREDNSEHYLIYHIRRDRENTVTGNCKQPLRKYIASHVPLGTDEKVLSFEEISAFSRWQKGGKTYGTELLGILKADLDNLGLIFSKGFENPARAERGDDIDRKTVSRFLTMSRMIELFFSGWITQIMSEQSIESLINEFTKMEDIDEARLADYLRSGKTDFGKIYTVYSGGDDMVLVGPWETIIIFSIFLNLRFRQFTCNNRFITLSAGLTFVKPRYPIASGIRQAEALLEKSKEEGKNRITLFGTTIEWGKLPKLIDFFLFLNEKLKDGDSNINPAFLYRLLGYHRMALGYFDNKKVDGLKYLSALSYDIGRNVVQWDKAGNITRGQEERTALQSLVNDKPDKDSLIYNLKVSLFWALYRNRGAGNEGSSSPSQKF